MYNQVSFFILSLEMVGYDFKARGKNPGKRSTDFYGCLDITLQRKTKKKWKKETTL